jgi:agmatinase
MKTISNAFISCNKDFDNSEIVIFGVPYDGTSSFRPGSRFAPDRIREASYGLETYSPEYRCDLENFKITDVGNIDIPFGDKKQVFEITESFTANLLKYNKRTLTLGGEHLISLPVLKSVFEKFNDLKVIHIDAHADLRKDYLNEKYSHATVMHCIGELIGFENIFHYGIRSGTEYEFSLMDYYKNLNRSFDYLKEKISGSNVYITLDLDVLDPSVLPGTGTPEPGGYGFNELCVLLKFINELNINIVGVDVVELSPDYDCSGVSSIVAAKIVRELLFCILLT